MATSKIFFYIKNVPASEESPFQVSVDDKLAFSETDGNADKSIVAEVSTPSIARKHVVNVRICIKAKNINTVQSFNLTDSGYHILIANDNGLKIAQKAVAFGSQPVTPRSAVSTPRQGFTIDPMTGEKKYVSSPRGGPVASPRKPSPSTTSSVTDKQYTMDDLERLSEMKNKGILSEEEFAQIKKSVLGL